LCGSIFPEVAGCFFQTPIGLRTRHLGFKIRDSFGHATTPDAGYFATELTALEGAEYVHGLPTFLPDGKHCLYIRVSRNAGRSGVYVGSVDAKPAEQSHQRILATLIAAGYADGNLVFMREGSLMAQPFDTDKLQLRGEPVVVAEHVGNMASFGYFSVSRAGVLTYRASAARALQATWFDRAGKQMGAAAETTPDQQLRLSPDGTRAGGRNGWAAGHGDIWLLDFSRGRAHAAHVPPGLRNAAGLVPGRKPYRFRGGRYLSLWKGSMKWAPAGPARKRSC
jgi:hypothetical protein